MKVSQIRLGDEEAAWVRAVGIFEGETVEQGDTIVEGAPVAADILRLAPVCNPAKQCIGG